MPSCSSRLSRRPSVACSSKYEPIVWIWMKKKQLLCFLESLQCPIFGTGVDLTYFVTHWQPQAPAREYRVGETPGNMPARMMARVEAIWWLGEAGAGVMLAKRRVVIGKSLPDETNILPSVLSSSSFNGSTHLLSWRLIPLCYTQYNLYWQQS